MKIDWNWTDEVLELAMDESEIVTQRTIVDDEWYLKFHFPGFPVLPGVLLIEAMAHTAGVLQSLRARRETGAWQHYVLVNVQAARFYRFAKPGDRVVMRARLPQGELDEARAKIEARVADSKVARCELVLRRLELEEVMGGENNGDPFGLANYLRRVLPKELWMKYDLGSGPQAGSRRAVQSDGSNC